MHPSAGCLYIGADISVLSQQTRHLARGLLPTLPSSLWFSLSIHSGNFPQAAISLRIFDRWCFEGISAAELLKIWSNPCLLLALDLLTKAGIQPFLNQWVWMMRERSPRCCREAVSVGASLNEHKSFIEICGTCAADMNLPLRVVGARSGAWNAEKIADLSWLMNVEQSSGTECCYPTACVLGRERDIFLEFSFRGAATALPSTGQHCRG